MKKGQYIKLKAIAKSAAAYLSIPLVNHLHVCSSNGNIFNLIMSYDYRN